MKLGDLFRQVDLKQLLLEWAYDGFETYNDYVKYGEIFIPLEKRAVEYTPAERQLTDGRSRPTCR